MEIPDNAIFLAIDVGGHRHRFVKTNQKAEILDQREIPNEVITNEAGELTGAVDKSDEFIEAVRDMLGPDSLEGIVMGSAGPITAASPWGHQRQSFKAKEKPEAVAEGQSFRKRVER